MSGLLERLAGGAAVVAVIAVVGTAGYFAVTKLGWDRTLEFLGFDVVAVSRAPDSQCARAQEQQTEDQAVVCISDRKWLRDYARACVDAEEPGLVFVDTDGTLTGTGRCPQSQRRQARALLAARIPKSYRVADAVEAFRAGQ